MSIFSQRSSGYKAGLVLLFIGSIFLIVGFASPNWMECTVTFEDFKIPDHHLIDPVDTFKPVIEDIQAHGGLWTGCMEESSTTHVHTMCEAFHYVPNWLMGVQGMQCVAVLGLVICGIYTVAVNWVLKTPPHNRLLEIVGVLSGLIGFVGVVVYMEEATKMDHKKMFEEADDHDKHAIHVLHAYCHVSWAFAIDVCACVMSFLAAIVIALNNQPLQAQVNPQQAIRTRQPVSQSGSVPRPQNDITIVPPQSGTPSTNLQVFYVPHANFTSTSSTPPPSMDLRPPAYDAHSPPLPSSQPPMVAVLPPLAGSLQPLPYAPCRQELQQVGPDPAVAASAAAVEVSLPPALDAEEKKVHLQPQVPES